MRRARYGNESVKQRKASTRSSFDGFGGSDGDVVYASGPAILGEDASAAVDGMDVWVKPLSAAVALTVNMGSGTFRLACFFVTFLAGHKSAH